MESIKRRISMVRMTQNRLILLFLSWLDTQKTFDEIVPNADVNSNGNLVL